MTEDGRQRTEGRVRRIEDGGQRAVDGGQISRPSRKSGTRGTGNAGKSGKGIILNFECLMLNREIDGRGKTEG